MTLREIFIDMGFNIDTKKAEETIEGVKHFAEKTLGVIGVAIGLSEIVKIADEYTQVNAELAGINDGLQTQAQLQKRVLNVANDTRQSYASTAEFIKGLIETNEGFFNIQKASDFAKVINQAFTADGITGEAAKSINQQLTMAMSSGGRIMGILKEAPGLSVQIAKGMGVTLKQLREMATQGLSPDLIYNALMKRAPEIEEEFNKMPMKFGQALTLIQNRWGSFIDKINKDTGGISFVANSIYKIVNGIFDYLERYIKQLGGIEQWLKLALTYVAAIWVAMHSEQLLRTLKSVGMYLREQYMIYKQFPGLYKTNLMLQAKETALTLINVAAWFALFLIVEDFVGFLQGKKSVIGDMLQSAGVNVDKFRAGLKPVVDMIGKFFKWIVQNQGTIAKWIYAILFAIGVLKILSVVIGIVNGVLWVLSANPVVLIIAAIIAGVIALIAVGYLLYKNWNYVWNNILGNKWVQMAISIFNPFIGLLLLVIKHWNGIVKVINTAINAIKTFLGLNNKSHNNKPKRNQDHPINSTIEALTKNKHPNSHTIGAISGSNKTNVVNQTNNFNNEFHGSDRDMQKKGADQMTKSGEQVSTQLAKQVAYHR